MPQAIECEFRLEGTGPPLLLIHGIGAARETWAKALPILTPHFTVITYDLRGHGTSPLPDKPFGLDDLVDDVEWVRAQTGFDQVHVAGHSLGGMIGPAYARAYPDRVLSLGLISTAAFRTAEDGTKVRAVVQSMRDQGIAAVLPTLTDRWFTHAFMAKHADVVARRMDQVLGTNAEVFLTVFDIYAQTEMGPWLGQIPHPALVITGQDDGGCPPRLNHKISQALPTADMIVLAGLKHSVLLEAGDLVAKHLRDFILGLSP